MTNIQTDECLYSVMVWIELARETEWLTWMQEHHVQAVVNQPGFLSVSMTKISTGPAMRDSVATYRMDYWTENMTAVDAYVAGAAKVLRKDLVDTFGDSAKAERVIGKCVATFVNQALNA